MERLILSTHNKGKVKEIESYLKDFNIEVLSISDIISISDIEENADTLEGNAKIKAEYIIDKAEGYILADDTGLFVEALDGNPGVHSARYAGEDVSDDENRKKLLKSMKNISNRNAYFKTVLVLIDKDNNEYIIDGVCKGYITQEEKGTMGFGYDSVFIPEGYSKTFAELDLCIKNKISHRAKALEKLKNLMVDLLNENSDC